MHKAEMLKERVNPAMSVFSARTQGVPLYPFICACMNTHTHTLCIPIHPDKVGSHRTAPRSLLCPWKHTHNKYKNVVLVFLCLHCFAQRNTFHFHLFLQMFKLHKIPALLASALFHQSLSFGALSKVLHYVMCVLALSSFASRSVLASSLFFHCRLVSCCISEDREPSPGKPLQRSLTVRNKVRPVSGKHTTHSHQSTLSLNDAFLMKLPFHTCLHSLQDSVGLSAACLRAEAILHHLNNCSPQQRTEPTTSHLKTLGLTDSSPLFLMGSASCLRDVPCRLAFTRVTLIAVRFNLNDRLIFLP